MKHIVGHSFAVVLAGSMTVVFGNHGRSSAQPSQPALIGGSVPLPSEAVRAIGESQVVLRLEVTKGWVRRIGVVSVQPSFARALLMAVANDTVRTWQFGSDATGDVLLTINYARGAPDVICGLRNVSVRMELPTRIDISGVQPRTICDDIVEHVIRPISLNALAGVVRCECEGQRPVAGALVSVSASDGSISRSARSDSQGLMRLDGLLPGRYEVEMSAPGYRSRVFSLLIDPTAGRGRADFALERDDREIPRSETFIESAQIPIYPAEARRNGIEGLVTLRVSLSGNSVIDINAEADSPVLGSAAIANVRTWSFRNTVAPVVTVGFRFRLDKGPCDESGGAVVVMDFPTKIEVTVRRPCGAMAGAEGQRRITDADAAAWR